MMEMKFKKGEQYFYLNDLERERDSVSRKQRNRLKKIITVRIKIAFRAQGVIKTKDTTSLIGCPVAFLKSHLENQFLPGMSWENHGEWHLDHIVPVSLGETEEEIVSLNHYTNLQPLWKDDNLIKSDNLILNMVSNESLIKYENIIKRIK